MAFVEPKPCMQCKCLQMNHLSVAFLLLILFLTVPLTHSLSLPSKCNRDPIVCYASLGFGPLGEPESYLTTSHLNDLALWADSLNRCRRWRCCDRGSRRQHNRLLRGWRNQLLLVLLLLLLLLLLLMMVMLLLLLLLLCWKWDWFVLERPVDTSRWNAISSLLQICRYNWL